MRNYFQTTLLNVLLLLNAPIRMQKRSQTRRMMRGYRHLMKKGRLHHIEDSVQHLREFRLSIPPLSLPRSLWGAASPYAELIIRQRLSCNYLEINRALLIASSMPKGKVCAPLPKIWLNQLQKQGFTIDYSLSAVAWQLLLVRHCFHGFAIALLMVGKSILQSKSYDKNIENYAYFCELSQRNLPATNEDVSSYNIINWFCRWPGRNRSIQSLRHPVPNSSVTRAVDYKVKYQANPVPPLFSVGNKIIFYVWVLQSFVRIAVSAALGHWWNILIYPESVTSSSVRIQSSSRLAQEYWFNNSLFYPPLWTYELPAKGSQAVFYFYTTNCEPFPRQDGSCPFVTPYSIMNWPRYLVWDAQQDDFISRCAKHSYKTELTGPIWFEDSDNSIQEAYATPFIALFDVTPRRSSVYQSFCMPSDCYSAISAINFLKDVLSVATTFNIPVIYKQKRPIGRLAHPQYQRFLDENIEAKLLTEFPASASAIRLISLASFVISVPRTSTALIAKDLGKPSIFYHPCHLPNSPADRLSGIEIISGSKNLHAWLKARC